MYKIFIYKITCKDPLVPDNYIGQTEFFDNRKYQHARDSKTSDLKLYIKIREHGGWDNWNMTILDDYHCKNEHEARQIEQKYIDNFNSNLNSIRAYSKPFIDKELDRKLEFYLKDYTDKLLGCYLYDYYLDFDDNKTIEVDNYSLVYCEYCDKTFTNIKKHVNICKERKKDNEKLIVEYEKKIQELKEYIIKLETENNIYKKDHETIIDIAKETNNTDIYDNKNIINIINNLSVFDDNKIINRFCNVLKNIKPSDLYDGQESIGRLVAPCLKNDDGTKMISCINYGRNIFIYKDKNGIIKEDIQSKKLSDLIEPIVMAKIEKILKEMKKI